MLAFRQYAEKIFLAEKLRICHERGNFTKDLLIKRYVGDFTFVNPLLGFGLLFSETSPKMSDIRGQIYFSWWTTSGGLLLSLFCPHKVKV